jgi:hypothetical protein
MILEQVDERRWIHVPSEMARIEIDTNPDPQRRARVDLLLPEASNIIMLSPATFARSEELRLVGFKAADAVHVPGGMLSRGARRGNRVLDHHRESMRHLRGSHAFAVVAQG